MTTVPTTATRPVAQIADDLEAAAARLRTSGLEHLHCPARLGFTAINADDPAAIVAELAAVFGLDPHTIDLKGETYHIAETDYAFPQGLRVRIQATGRDNTAGGAA